MDTVKHQVRKSGVVGTYEGGLHDAVSLSPLSVIFLSRYSVFWCILPWLTFNGFAVSFHAYP